MTYATVMVSLALNESNEARLEAAGQIAERFEAGIVGIAAAQFSPPLYYSLGEQAQNLIDQGEAAHDMAGAHRRRRIGPDQDARHLRLGRAGKCRFNICLPSSG